jgi:porphyrinogen peroxidase
MGFILPQFGIFAQGTHAHHFLEFDVLPGITADQAMASFRRLRAPEVSSGGVNLVVAFGSRAWRTVAPSGCPASLTDFQGIEGTDGHSVPPAQHDVWLWISGSAPDVTWSHARAAKLAVGDVAKLASEQQAFTYLDNRDFTGFIDGSANPPIRRAPDVALVPAGQPGEGGSHVLVMKWIHDLDAFNSLTVEDQERVVGRSKVDSIEIPAALRPPDAHVSRVTVEDKGQEVKIFRRSVPYGNLEEQGLCFVAFSADPSRFDLMLSRMFGTSKDGIRDRFTDYSRAAGGARYFAPSLNSLNEIAGPESP